MGARGVFGECVRRFAVLVAGLGMLWSHFWHSISSEIAICMSIWYARRLPLTDSAPKPLHHLLVDCESLTLLFFILISLWRSCPLQNFPCVCILELVSCGVMCYMLNDCTFGNRESAYDEFERLNVVVHGSGVSWSHL